MSEASTSRRVSSAICPCRAEDKRMEEGVKARATAIEIGAGSGDFSRGVRGSSRGLGRELGRESVESRADVQRLPQAHHIAHSNSSPSHSASSSSSSSAISSSHWGQNHSPSGISRRGGTRHCGWYGSSHWGQTVGPRVYMPFRTPSAGRDPPDPRGTRRRERPSRRVPDGGGGWTARGWVSRGRGWKRRLLRRCIVSWALCGKTCSITSMPCRDSSSVGWVVDFPPDAPRPSSEVKPGLGLTLTAVQLAVSAGLLGRPTTPCPNPTVILCPARSLVMTKWVHPPHDALTM